MRVRRVMAVAAAVAGIAGVIAPAAGADSPHPWTPFRSESFTDAPGVVCSFGVQGDPVVDKEQVRTLQTNPDGSPFEQEFVGELIFRFTNLSTGASVERNLTGTGIFFFHPDGSITGNARGSISFGVHIGNPTSPTGEWVLTGRSEFNFAADGVRTFSLNGTQENLCDTLA